MRPYGWFAVEYWGMARKFDHDSWEYGLFMNEFYYRYQQARKIAAVYA